jgi:hypothetical protein
MHLMLRGLFIDEAVSNTPVLLARYAYQWARSVPRIEYQRGESEVSGIGGYGINTPARNIAAVKEKEFVVEAGVEAVRSGRLLNASRLRVTSP